MNKTLFLCIGLVVLTVLLSLEVYALVTFVGM